MVNLKQINRNKKLVKDVLKRDLELCKCCGFKGSEVHHIIPLILGGVDKAENMVTLCSFCHKYAPNSKEEFIEYVNRGGAKYEMLLGNFANICEKEGLEFHKHLPLFKKMLSAVRRIEHVNALETYNLKELFNQEINEADLK